MAGVELLQVPDSIGGEGGIRTPGPFRVNGFQDRRFRPLSHLSEGWGARREPLGCGTAIIAHDSRRPKHFMRRTRCRQCLKMHATPSSKALMLEVGNSANSLHCEVCHGNRLSPHPTDETQSAGRAHPAARWQHREPPATARAFAANAIYATGRRECESIQY